MFVVIVLVIHKLCSDVVSAVEGSTRYCVYLWKPSVCTVWFVFACGIDVIVCRAVVLLIRVEVLL
jgi:hypothetical protein